MALPKRSDLIPCDRSAQELCPANGAGRDRHSASQPLPQAKVFFGGWDGNSK
jgi:hypothetical protein